MRRTGKKMKMTNETTNRLLEGEYAKRNYSGRAAVGQIRDDVE